MTGLEEYESELSPKLQGIPHAAARVGHGSEVLGFDTDQSRDHDWGPLAAGMVSGRRLAPPDRCRALFTPASGPVDA